MDGALSNRLVALVRARQTTGTSDIVKKFFSNLSEANMKILNDVPTEDDWEWGGEGFRCSDLDKRDAHDKFFGKSIEDMLPYFKELPLSASEDLWFMPDTPFRYYVLAFKMLLMSQKNIDELGCDASDAASTFLCLLRHKLENSPQLVLPVMEELMPVVEHVAANQNLFDADPEIYGSFPDKLVEIKRLYADARSASQSN